MPVNYEKHKALDAYYADLERLRAQGVTNEQGLQPAFQHLLETLGRAAGWTLVPQQALPLSRRRPDGTLFDEFHFPRGYWEAKDTGDDLETEIAKKIAAGYDIRNTIFEDTHEVVLYQDKQRVHKTKASNCASLADILRRFFEHHEPPIEEFEAAVTEFKQRIPDLAEGLMKRIDEERKTNPRFTAAFDGFHTLCKSSLDPRISAPEIEEMLVQHLLTERLFRTVFDDPDFTRRNVIACEIERVVDALTSRAFNRQDFFKQLDRFYVAIETAARAIGDFGEKQGFLNIVYERFFQGFSAAKADTHGIVYTPQAIVDFMCASVEEVLKSEFGCDLSTEGVQILDPCVGTGNFIVNILRRIQPSKLPYKYRNDIFANEIMLLPYYIAALNIEREYFERTGQYEPFEGLCFTDTLDLAEPKQTAMFTEENTERVEREKKAKITVIIGNPPYNVGQRSENDQNKNRAYPVVDQRIRETYSKDSRATNKNALWDMYVRFFRWATDRLEKRDGMVAFVSNNGFLNGVAFDGFRQHALRDFTCVYHVDTKGNARTSGERRRREGGNLFHNQIRAGVGITLLVRKGTERGQCAFYYAVPDGWAAERKVEHLASLGQVSRVPWMRLAVDAHANWLTQELRTDFAAFLAVGGREGKSATSSAVAPMVFRVYGRGVATCRDNWVYDFDRSALVAKVCRLVENYNAEVDRWRRSSDPTARVDDFVTYDDKKLKWSRDLKSDVRRGNYARFTEGKVRSSLYRPFCRRHLFLDRVLNEEVYLMPAFFPTPTTESENKAILVPGLGNRATFGCLATTQIPALDLAFEKIQCFPFYVYNEDGTNRRENVTDWVLAQFRERYGPEVTKWDIFHYVYAMLHHPIYRERYAENLKRELPRIPFIKVNERGNGVPPVSGDHGQDAHATFRRFVEIGKRLADIHLGYESAAEYPLKRLEHTDREHPFTYRVKKMRLSKDKTTIAYNESLTLGGVPPEAFEYRLGNRSALEWVIDQYQVTTHKRSGIASDPNRPDDPEYIVRLIGQVITVSLETVKLVNDLRGFEW